jgi:hypothetical protein
MREVMIRHCPVVLQVVIASCVLLCGARAQDLNADVSTVKLFTLNNLDVVAGMVYSVDSISVSVRKLNNAFTEIPRRSIMKIDELYRYVDHVPGGYKANIDTSMLTLWLIGGVAVTGRPVSKSSSSLIFRLQEGRFISIPLVSIMNQVEDEYDSVDSLVCVKSNVHFDNHNLFTAPTGRAQGMGNASIHWSELFLLDGSFGLSDFLALSGGTSISGSMFNGSIKVSAPGPDWLHLSGGVSYVSGDGKSCFLPFIAATVGSGDLSFTADIIYGIGHHAVPALVVGGEARISRRTRFILEHWQTLGTGSGSAWAFSIIGFRTFVSREIALDFGLMFMNRSMEMDGSWNRASGYFPWGTLRYNID